MRKHVNKSLSEKYVSKEVLAIVFSEVDDKWKE